MSERHEDGIEALLRSTGRRPAPPAERTARVREAVHAHWRAQRRTRVRRRVLWMAAAAAAIVLITLAWLPRPTRGIAAHVERVEATSAVHPGEVLETGRLLSTGAGQRVALRLRSGDAVRLDQRTRLRLVSQHALALEAGTIYVDSTSETGSLEVHTPFGSLRKEGTQFIVQLEQESLRVMVREGRVALGRGRDRILVGAGQRLTFQDGGPRVGPQATSGGDWAWADAIAPMMAIEGRSAQEFLAWIAREKGLTLRFAGEEIARAAGTTVLRGSVEGMTLDQALDAVLPTCGMRHRIEAGVLLVEPRQ